MVSPLLICKSISSLRVPFLLAHALDHINPLTMQRAEMTQVQTFPASSKSDILMNIKNVHFRSRKCTPVIKSLVTRVL